MRRRLVLAIAGVATAAVVLFAIPLGIVLHRSYRDEELLRLQRDTIGATRQIDIGAAGRDPVELPHGTDVLTVYDAAGRRVAGTGPQTAGPLVRSALGYGRPVTAAHGNELDTAIALLNGERVAGAVLATRDDHRVDEDTRNAWLALGALALALVALATGAAVLFGRRLSLPLERLAGTAGRLGSGDFSVRAPRSGVAEIDALSAAMDTTAERLDDLVTRERAFSVDASHQLRTPLAALRIELEAMQLRRDTGPELAAALVQVDRLQTTIDTLLSVARDASSAAATTDVVGVVDDAIERWRGRLAEAGRPLRSRAEGRPARALANPGVLQEILDVLLDNALRHGAGEVDVTVRDLDGWVAVEVRDEGSGFADPDAAFARRSGRAAGHGIGLALARSLAHAEGGRLTVVHPGPAPVLSIAVRSDPGAGGPAR